MLVSRAASHTPLNKENNCAPRSIYLRAVAAFALFAAAFFASMSDARAQIDGSRMPIGGPGGEHSIYGEFKVDESKAKEKVPGSFVLVLMNEAGRVVERQSVMHNARFNFFGLRNGTYEIIVEAAGMPVARVRVMVQSSRKTEFKQDILLEWETVGGGNPDAKGSTVSAADFYERTPANRVLFDKAAGAVRKKKYDEAAEQLKKIIEADPKDYVAWSNLGAAQNSLGRADDAELSFRRALELKPDLLSASINLGRLYVVGKQFDKAAEVLRPAAEKYTQSADAHLLLGEALLQTRQLEESETHFREALRIDPQGQSDAHLRIALIKDATGRKDLAAVELEQFIAKRPDHPNRRQFEKYVKDNKKK